MSGMNYSVSNGNDSGAGSLRQAILDANDTTDPYPHIIIIDPIVGSITLNSSLPQITTSITIEGNNTIIDGNSDPIINIIDIDLNNFFGSEIILRNLNLQNANRGVYFNGGNKDISIINVNMTNLNVAVQVSNNSSNDLLMDNCNIDNCINDDYCILLVNSRMQMSNCSVTNSKHMRARTNSRIEINNCIFDGNQGDNNENGGALRLEEDVRCTINNSQIINNSLSGIGGSLGGAAIYAERDVILEITNSLINNNNIPVRVRINGVCITMLQNCSLSIDNCEINDNTSVPEPSAGSINACILCINSENVSITNSKINQNSGGIDIDVNNSITIDKCSVNENRGTGLTIGGNSIVTNSTISGNVGGVSISTDSTSTLANCTISGNQSENIGGILVNNNTDDVTFINCTIVNNTQTQQNSRGGGINNISTLPVILQNTMVALNTVTNIGSLYPDLSGDFTGSQYSLVGDITGSTGINTGVNNLYGDAINPLNPIIGLLSDNGGPTLTIPIYPLSPGFDKGSDILANQAGLIYDQRGVGFDRIVNGRVDIGAYEIQADIICYLGSSKILTKNSLTSEIKELKVKDVKSGIHQVYNSASQQFIPVKLNIVTGKNSKFVLLKKNCLGKNMPYEDFYITPGHKIVLNNCYIKARDIPQGIKIRLKPCLVYSICTKNQCPISVNGIGVLTWDYDEWIQYSKINHITWYDNYNLPNFKKI